MILIFNLFFFLLSQNATPTLWDSLEEPDIRDTSEFEYLFSKDTTQQKKKPLSETYEKKNKVKKVFGDYSNRIYCHMWAFIMCFWFAISLFSKNVLEGFKSLMTEGSSWRNLCLVFQSCLTFQTVFLI